MHSYLLVDSGADSSLIDKSIFQKIPKHLISNRTFHSVSIRGISGSTLENVGQATISTRIGHNHFPISFHIVEGLGKAGLLGSDFFHSVGATIDFAQQTLCIGNDIILLTPKKQAHGLSLVRTTQKIVLPPYSESVICVSLVNSALEGSFVVSPISNCPLFKDEPGLLFPDVLVQVSGSRKFPIQITNDTPFTKTFKGNSPIGIAELIPIETEILSS